MDTEIVPQSPPPLRCSIKFKLNMKKLQNSEIENALKAQPEAGPVYVRKENSPVETIAVDGADIKKDKGQFGEYLTINAEGVGTRIVNIRKDDPNAATGSTFKLEVWKAIRALSGSANRRPVSVGTEKVFAIPA